MLRKRLAYEYMVRKTLRRIVQNSKGLRNTRWASRDPWPGGFCVAMPAVAFSIQQYEYEYDTSTEYGVQNGKPFFLALSGMWACGGPDPTSSRVRVITAMRTL